LTLIRPVTALAALVTLAVVVPVPVAAGETAPEYGAQQQWRVTTVAGIGRSGYSGDGGPATEARIGGSIAYGPRLAVAKDGTVYLAEWANHRMRRVTPDGVIDTVPGTFSSRGGFARAADVGADGTPYLGTEGGILRVGPRGVTTVPAKSGLLSDLTVDAAGNIYYALSSFDPSRHSEIVRVDKAGTSRTLLVVKPEIYSVDVGPGGVVYYTTGDFQPKGRVVGAVGPDGARRTVATLPEGGVAGAVAVSGDGTPHVVDAARGRLLAIGPQGTLTPVGPDVPGPIDDLAFGPGDVPYLVGGATVRKVERAAGGEPAPRPAASHWADDEPGTVHRVAGTGQEPAIDQPGLGTPAVGPDGTVYVVQPRRNLVHAIDRDGRVTRFAGTGTLPPLDEDPHRYDGTKATEANLRYPFAVAAADNGEVNIATRRGILRVGKDGTVETRAVFDDFFTLPADVSMTHGLAVDDAGTVFYTDTDGPIEGLVRTLTADGNRVVAGQQETDGRSSDVLPGPYSENKPALRASLRGPTSISVGDDGTVYLIETGNEDAVHAVRAIRPDGTLVTVAGNSALGLGGQGTFAGDGGQARKAGLNNPRGVAAGPDGSFYIADTYNERIRRVARTGVITTVAGSGRRGETGDGGQATEAGLLDPSGVAVGGDGTVYVTSASSTRVRAIAPDGTISTLADLAAPASGLPLATIGVLESGRDGSVYLGARDGLSVLGQDGDVRHLRGLFAGGTLAAGPDGSVYEVTQEYSSDTPSEPRAALWRRYPDGTVLRLAADEPLTGIRTVAVGPRGEVYLGSGNELFRLADGRPERVLSTLDAPFNGSRETSDPNLRAVTVGPDGTVYLAAVDRVFAMRGGKPEVVAGNGETYSSDEAEAEEDGGQARDASLNEVSDVAVTRDGTVFVATGDGVRRVREGVIETIGAGVKEPEQLTVVPSGDLYVASDEEVFAVVRPAAVEIDRTSWLWLWLGGGAMLLLAAGAFGCLRLLGRRKPSSETAAPAAPSAACPDEKAAPETNTGSPDPDAAPATDDAVPAQNAEGAGEREAGVRSVVESDETVGEQSSESPADRRKAEHSAQSRESAGASAESPAAQNPEEARKREAREPSAVESVETVGEPTSGQGDEDDQSD
jgi:hypothetical protein